MGKILNRVFGRTPVTLTDPVTKEKFQVQPNGGIPMPVGAITTYLPANAAISAGSTPKQINGGGALVPT